MELFVVRKALNPTVVKVLDELYGDWVYKGQKSEHVGFIRILKAMTGCSLAQADSALTDYHSLYSNKCK